MFGGRARVWSALLGVPVIQPIAYGMALLRSRTAVQFMITGGILLLTVAIDSLSRRAQKPHGQA
ncbi:hypothetical protein [Streptomyces altiplanensis]